MDNATGFMDERRLRLAPRMAAVALVTLLALAVVVHVEAWPAFKPRPVVMERALVAFLLACTLLFASWFLSVNRLSQLFSAKSSTVQQCAQAASLVDLFWITGSVGSRVALSGYLLAIALGFAAALLLRARLIPSPSDAQP